MVDHVTANKRRARLLIAAFTAVVLVLALAVDLVVGGGAPGLAVVVAVSVAGAWWASRKSDAVALAVSGARPADPVRHARLLNVVDGLCVAAGLPRPTVYVIEDDALNSFATGRDPRHAAVAVTTGLLDRMSRIELEAVLAHELSHVKSYDIRSSTLAVTTVGLAALVADRALRLRSGGGGGRGRDGGPPGIAALVAVPGFLALAVAPVAGRAMQVAVHRRREGAADVTAVSLTRYPPGLISALEKLQAGPTVVRSASPATAHLWIESPVPRADSGGRLAWLGRLFDTHPPLQERIEALREL